MRVPLLILSDSVAGVTGLGRIARELADRIIVLHNGTLVADGDPATVIASPVVQEAYLGVSEPKEGA